MYELQKLYWNKYLNLFNYIKDHNSLKTSIDLIPLDIVACHTWKYTEEMQLKSDGYQSGERHNS